MMSGPPSTEAADVPPAAAAALEADHHWYQSIELAPGVVTPGRVDLRRTAARILPDDLTGKRALDVGTFDGFWAFELERRGAEVVATDLPSPLDVELPPPSRELLEATTRDWNVDLGRGFRLASEVLGSKVERRECNIYDLSPEAIGGEVDFVFIGALLQHLRDPVRGLERARSALAPGGELLSLEHVSLLHSALGPRRPLARFQATSTYYSWWLPNRAGHRGWLEAAGFERVRSHGLHRPRQQKPIKGWMQALVGWDPMNR